MNINKTTIESLNLSEIEKEEIYSEKTINVLGYDVIFQKAIVEGVEVLYTNSIDEGNEFDNKFFEDVLKKAYEIYRKSKNNYYKNRILQFFPFIIEIVELDFNLKENY